MCQTTKMKSNSLDGIFSMNFHAIKHTLIVFTMFILYLYCLPQHRFSFLVTIYGASKGRYHVTEVSISPELSLIPTFYYLSSIFMQPSLLIRMV